METVLRAAVVYAFLFVVFRIAGKRTLAQITPFDFVLLLIVGEATQQGLIGDDFSIATALLLISSLVGIDVAISLVQERFPRLGPLLEGSPVIVVEHGRLLEERLKNSRIDQGDVMESARQRFGIERLEQIRFAVLERDGSISVVPEADAAWRDRQASSS